MEIVQDCINMLKDAIDNLPQPEDDGATQREYDEHCRRESSMWRFV